MRRNRVLRVTMACLIVLLGVVLVLRWMFWSAPGWYDPPTAADSESATLADQVEHRFAEETHRIRDREEPWTLRIRDHQVNAWLAIRLPEWIERETGESWPEAIGMPQVRFREHTVQLTLPIRDGKRMRHLVADFEPVLDDESDHLTLVVTRLAHGRLPLPGAPDEMLNTFIDQHLPESLPEDDEVLSVVVDLVRGGSMERPQLELQDGRVIEVQRIALSGGGAMDVQARTIHLRNADHRVPETSESAD